MNRTNIDIALNIYDLCFKPVLASRSISEIRRHLVRVEGWFLAEIGIESHTGDPGL
ncbi:hypothetical protein IIA29_07830 [candidate division KSB1 bacterium]|nr:hypothetical protein [candidate division KSB1 bacterium]